MALTTLLFGEVQKGTRISRNIGGKTASIVLDATVNESFEAPCEVTDHEVEKDVDVSDHVILKPQMLSIEGKISETPFDLNSSITGATTSVAATIGQSLGGAVGGALAAFGTGKTLAGVLSPKSVTGEEIDDPENRPGENPRLRDAIEEFMQIRNSKKPVTIVTGLKQYADYILLNFKCTRANPLAEIQVMLSFKEIRFAESQNVQIEIPKTKAAVKGANQGKKAAKAVEGQRGQSMLSALTGIKQARVIP